MIFGQFVQWLVANTLFPEMTNHHNHEDGFKGTLEVTTSYMYGKHGIEIRIWSLSEDNSQSWVRISHVSSKFVIDSNYNNTEVPVDLPENQASKSSVKVIAARSKAKAKPQKRETDELPSIIPMNEGKWIDIEPAELSLCVRGLEESGPSSSTFSASTTRRRRSSSILENQVSSSESISTNFLLVGCSLENLLGSRRRFKKKISVLL